MLFTFQENDGYNQLMLAEIEKHPLNGWSINPHRYPTQIGIYYLLYEIFS